MSNLLKLIFLTHFSEKPPNIFEKHNILIDNHLIIKSTKNNNSIKVPENLFQALYSQQVINQYRVDSLLNISYESFFLINHNNEKLLNTDVLVNCTLMEELYLIKKLFDKKILLKQDCESGYYYVIHCPPPLAHPCSHGYVL